MARDAREWTVPAPIRALMWWPAAAFVLVMIAPEAAVTSIAAAGAALMAVGALTPVLARRLRGPATVSAATGAVANPVTSTITTTITDPATNTVTTTVTNAVTSAVTNAVTSTAMGTPPAQDPPTIEIEMPTIEMPAVRSVA